MTKVAIIGGGASGLMSAILLAQKGACVTLFEANEHLGKKIVASGNGHCNISNKNISSNNYSGSNLEFINKVLEKLSFYKLEKLFKQFGLLFDIKDDGKAYPLSLEAKCVVEILRTNALNSGVCIMTNQKIINVQKKGNFLLKSETDKFTNFHNVIIATGSEAASSLGGNDSGYKIAQSFGHTIIKTYPSLVQLKLKGKSYIKMSGVRQFSKVTLIINKQIKQEVIGDLLFTHYGISGTAILDLSQKASLALSLNKQVEITINMLFKFEYEKLNILIKSLCKQLPQITFFTLLSGIIHKKIATKIFDILEININIKAIQCHEKMIKKIIDLLTNWKFEVEQTRGFKYAKVSGGGISTTEINSISMQSKKCKGIYFIGEILDVVGKRGGYNFHFAWATAYNAAKAINLLH